MSTAKNLPAVTQAFEFLHGNDGKALLSVNPGVSAQDAAEYLYLLLDVIHDIQRRLSSGSYDEKPEACQELHASVHLSRIARGIAGGLGGCP